MEKIRVLITDDGNLDLASLKELIKATDVPAKEITDFINFANSLPRLAKIPVLIVPLKKTQSERKSGREAKRPNLVSQPRPRPKIQVRRGQR